MDDPKAKKRVAHCSRCKNHGLNFPLKGHKRYCRFATCGCARCALTEQKQKVMAQHIALRRQQKLEEENGPMEDVEPPPSSPDLASVSNQHANDQPLSPGYSDRIRRHSMELQPGPSQVIPRISDSSMISAYRTQAAAVYSDAPEVVDMVGRRLYNEVVYVQQPGSLCRNSASPSTVYQHEWPDRYVAADSTSSIRVTNPVEPRRNEPPPTPALDLSINSAEDNHKRGLLLHFKDLLELSDSALPLMELVCENAGWNRDKIMKQLGRAEKTLEDLGLWPRK